MILNDLTIKDISVTIITKDASKHLNKCLQALKMFSEVIVVDNGSTDNTLEIASKFGNVKLFEHDFIGFGPLKKLATTYAKNDWILSIDSDEIIPEDLVKYLYDLKLDNEYVYTLRRLNHYDGRPIKGAGWYPDKVKRIFNRSETNFNDNMVHESVVSLKVKDIPLHIEHYTCENASQMLQKMDKYTTIYANSNPKKKTTFLKAIVSAKWAFIKAYFIKKGFLYGIEGFVISLYNALGAFFKHFKLLEKNKSQKNKDIFTSDENNRT